MSTQNTSASIDLNRQLLYYTIRLRNTDDTLHAWMRHILAYLTTTADDYQPCNDDRQPQEPSANSAQSESCDGSSDCQTNSWVRELSYEQHCRKLLASRVNVGDTQPSGGVDEDSLRREASLVMESVNRSVDGESESEADGAETPMDVDDELAESSEDSSTDSSSQWDFVMYDSDLDSEVDSIDDPTYRPCGSDSPKLDSEYSSEYDDEFNVDVETDSDREENIEEENIEVDEIDNVSNYTYDVHISTSLRLNPAGNTEQRTVNILRQYNNCGGNAKQLVHANGGRCQRSVGIAQRLAATDDNCEYYCNCANHEGDEYAANEWGRPSSN